MTVISNKLFKSLFTPILQSILNIKSKRLKLDLFNLFYSSAAVLILIGVIAKLLEWPSQDMLMTIGLSTEALVFAASAVKFIEISNKQNTSEESLAKIVTLLSTLLTKPIVPNSDNPNHISANSKEMTSEVAFDDISVIHHKYNFNKTPLTINNGFTFEHALWQLQSDLLNVLSDLIYQPKWVDLNEAEYNSLQDLLLRVFNKKLPKKIHIPFLLNFPIPIPKTNIQELSIMEEVTIDDFEIELLIKALTLSGFNDLFDYFIIENKFDATSTIRSKKSNENQIFGGESQLILNYAQNYFKSKLIISPKVDILANYIRFVDNQILEYYIDKFNFKDDVQSKFLSEILIDQYDDLKEKFIYKIPKLIFESNESIGYNQCSSIIRLLSSFENRSLANSILKNKLQLQTDTNTYITLNEVVHYFSDVINFGDKNEYSIKINDLFLNGEVANLTFVNKLISKLHMDEVSDQITLRNLFGLDQYDTKVDLLSKLNFNSFNYKDNLSQDQMSFILLLKQYN